MLINGIEVTRALIVRQPWIFTSSLRLAPPATRVQTHKVNLGFLP